MIGPSPVYSGPSVAGLGVLQHQFGWKPTPNPYAAIYPSLSPPQFRLGPELEAQPYFSLSQTLNLNRDLTQARRDSYLPTAVNAPINVLKVDNQGRPLSLPNIVKTIPLGPVPDEALNWAPAPPSTKTEPLPAWVPAEQLPSALPFVPDQQALSAAPTQRETHEDPITRSVFDTAISDFNGSLGRPSLDVAATGAAPVDNAIGVPAGSANEQLGFESPGALAGAVGGLNHARSAIGSMPVSAVAAGTQSMAPQSVSALYNTVEAAPLSRTVEMQPAAELARSLNIQSLLAPAVPQSQISIPTIAAEALNSVAAARPLPPQHPDS